MASLNPNLATTATTGSGRSSRAGDGASERSGAETPTAAFHTVGETIITGDVATPARRLFNTTSALSGSAGGGAAASSSSVSVSSSRLVHSTTRTITHNIDPELEAQIKRTKAQSDRNLESLLQQLEVVIEERDTLIVQSESMHTQITQLEGDVLAYERRLQASDATRASLELRIEKQNENLAQANLNIQALEAKVEEHQQKWMESSTQHSRMLEHLDRVKAERERKHQDELRALKVEFDVERAQWEHTRRALDDKIRGFDAQLAAERLQRDELAKTLAQRDTLIVSLHEQVATAESRFRKREEEYQVAIKDLQGNIAALQQHLAQHQAERDAMHAEIDNYRTQLPALKNQLTTQLAYIESSNKEHENILAALRALYEGRELALRQEIDHINGSYVLQLRDMREKNDRRMQELEASLQADLTACKVQLENKNQEIAVLSHSLQLQVARVKEAEHSYEARLSALRDEHAKAEDALAGKYKAEIARLQGLLDTTATEAHRQRRQAEESFAATLMSVKQQHSAELAALHDDAVKHEQQRVAEITRQMELQLQAREKALMGENAQLTQRIEQLRTTLTEKTTVIDSLILSEARAKEALAALQVELAALKDKYQQLHPTIDARDRDLSISRTSFDEVSRKLRELTTLHAQQTTAFEALKAEEAGLRAATQRLAAERDELRTKLAAAEQQYGAWLLEKQELVKRLQSLDSEIIISKQQLDHLRAQGENQKRLAAEALEKEQRNQTVLVQQITESHTTIAELRGQMGKLGGDISALQEELRISQADVQRHKGLLAAGQQDIAIVRDLAKKDKDEALALLRAQLEERMTQVRTDSETYVTQIRKELVSVKQELEGSRQIAEDLRGKHGSLLIALERKDQELGRERAAHQALVADMEKKFQAQTLLMQKERDQLTVLSSSSTTTIRERYDAEIAQLKEQLRQAEIAHAADVQRERARVKAAEDRLVLSEEVQLRKVSESSTKVVEERFATFTTQLATMQQAHDALIVRNQATAAARERELQDQLAAAEKKIAAAKAREAELAQRVERLETTVEVTRRDQSTEIRRLQEEVRVREERIQVVEHHVVETQQRSVQAADKEKETLTEQLTAAHDTIHRLQSSLTVLERDKGNASALASALEQQLQVLRQQFAAQSQTVSTLTDQSSMIASLQALFEEKEKALRGEYESSLARLQAQLLERERERDGLTIRVDEYSRLIERLRVEMSEKLQAAAKREADMADHHSKMLSGLQVKFNEDLTKMEQTHDRATKALSDRLRDQDSLVARLVTENQELKRKSDGLEAALHVEQEKLLALRQQHMAEMSVTLKQHEEKIAALQAANQARIDELQRTLAATHAEVNRLHALLRDKSTELSDLRNSMAAIIREKEIEWQKLREHDLQAQADKYEARLRVLMDDKQGLQELVAKLRGELASAERTATDLAAQLQQAKAALVVETARATQAREQLEAEQRAHHATRDRIVELERELSIQRGAVAHFKELLAAADKKNGELSQLVADLQAALDGLRQQYTNTARSLALAQDDSTAIETLKRMFAEKEALLRGEYEQTLAEIQTQASLRAAQLAAKEQELELKQRELLAYVQDLEEARRNIADHRSMLIEMRNRFEDQKRVFDDASRKQKDELLMLKADYERKEAELRAHYEDTFNDLLARFDQLRAFHAAMEEEKLALEKQLTELTASSKREIHDLLGRLEAVSLELQRERLARADVEARLKQALADLDVERRSTLSLKDELAQLRLLFEATRREQNIGSIKQADLDRERARVKALEEQLAALEESQARKLLESQSTATRSIEDRFASFTTQLTTMQQAHDALISRTQAIAAARERELQDQLAAAEKKVAAGKAREAELAQRVERLETTVEVSHAQQSSEIRRLEQEVRVREERIHVVEQRVVETQQRSLETGDKEKESLTARLTLAHESLHQMQSVIANLEREKAQANAEAAGLVQQLQLLQKQFIAIQREAASTLDTDNARLVRSLQSTFEEKEGLLRAEYERNLADLQSLLDAKSREISHLSLQVDEASHARDELRVQLSETVRTHSVQRETVLVEQHTTAVNTIRQQAQQDLERAVQRQEAERRKYETELAAREKYYEEELRTVRARFEDDLRRERAAVDTLRQSVVNVQSTTDRETRTMLSSLQTSMAESKQAMLAELSQSWRAELGSLKDEFAGISAEKDRALLESRALLSTRESNVAEYTRTLAEKDSTIVELRRSISQLEAQVRSLRENSSEDAQRLLADRQRLQAELAEARTSLETSVTIRKGVESRVLELQSALEAAEGRLRAAGAERDKLLQERERDIAARLLALRGEHKQAMDVSAAEHAAVLQQLKKTHDEALKILRQEHASSLDALAQRLKSQEATLREQLVSEQARSAALSAKIVELERQLQNDTQAAEKRLKELLEASRAEYEKTIADLRASQDEQLKFLKEEYLRAKSHLSPSLLKEKDAIIEGHLHTIHKLQARVTQLESELAGSSNRAAALEARMSSLDAELRAKADEIVRLEAEVRRLADAGKRQSVLQAMLDERDRQVAELKLQVQGLDAQLDRTSAAHEKLARDNADLCTAFELLQHKYESLKENLDILSTQHNAELNALREEHNAELQARETAHAEAMRTLQSRLDRAVSQLSDMQHQLVIVTENRDHIVRQHSEQMAAERAAHEQAAAQLRNSFEQSLRALRDQHENAMKNLRADWEMRLQQSEMHHAEEKDMLQRALAQARKDLADIQVELARQAQEARDQLERLRQEHLIEREKLATTLRQRHELELQALIESNESRVRSLQASLAQEQQAAAQQQAKITTLQELLSKRDSELEALRSRSEALERQLASISSALASRDERIASLEARIQKLVAEHKTTLEAERKASEGKLAAAHAELHRLQTLLHDSERAQSDSARTTADLKQALEELRTQFGAQARQLAGVQEDSEANMTLLRNRFAQREEKLLAEIESMREAHKSELESRSREFRERTREINVSTDLIQKQKADLLQQAQAQFQDTIGALQAQLEAARTTVVQHQERSVVDVQSIHTRQVSELEANHKKELEGEKARAAALADRVRELENSSLLQSQQMHSQHTTLMSKYRGDLDAALREAEAQRKAELDAQRRKYEVRISQLETQVNEEHSRQSELEAALARMRDTLRAKEDQIASFARAASDLTSKLAVRDGTIVDLEQKLKALQLSLAEQQAASERALAAAKAQFASERSGLQTQVQKLHVQLHEKDQLAAQLRSEADGALAHLRLLKDQYTAQMAQVDSMRVEHDQAMEALRSAAAQREASLRAEFEQQLSTLSTQLSARQVEVADLTQQLQTTQAINKRMQTEHAEAMARLQKQCDAVVASVREQHESEMRQLREEYQQRYVQGIEERKKLKEQLEKEFGSQIEELRRRSDVQVARIRELEELLEAKERDFATRSAKFLQTQTGDSLTLSLKQKFESEVASLRSANDALVKRLRDELAAAQAETSALNEKLVLVREELRRKSAEADALAGRLTTRESELAQAQTALRVALDKAAALEKQLTTEQQRAAAELEALRVKLMADLLRAQETARALEERNAQLTSENTTLVRSTEDLKRSLAVAADAATRAKAELAEKIQAHSEELRVLRTSYQEREAALNAELTDAKNALSVQRKALQARIDELERTHEVRIAKLQADAEAARQAREAEYEKQYSALQAKKDAELAALTAKHESRVAALLKEIETLQTTADTCRAAADRATSAMQALEREKADLASRLQHLQASHDSKVAAMTEQINQLDAQLRTQAQAHRVELETLRRTASEQQQALQAEYEGRLKALSARHAESMSKLQAEFDEKLRQQLAAHQAALARLESEYASREQSLNEQLRKLTAELASVRTELSTKIALLEKITEQAQQEKAALEREILTLQSARTSLRDERDRALATLDSREKEMSAVETRSINTQEIAKNELSIKLTKALLRAEEAEARANSLQTRLSEESRRYEEQISMQSKSEVTFRSIIDAHSTMLSQADVSSRIEESRQEVTRAQARAQELEKELLSLRTLTETKRVDVEREFRTQLSAGEDQRRQLQSRLTTIETQLRESERRCQNVESDKAELALKFNALQKKCEDFDLRSRAMDDDTRAEFERRLAQSREATSKLSSEITELQSQLTILRTQRDKLDEEGRVQREEIDRLRQEHSKMSLSLSAAEMSGAEARRQLELAQSQIETLTRTVATLRTEHAAALEAARAGFDEQLRKALASQKLQLEQISVQLRSDLDATLARLAASEKDRAALQVESDERVRQHREQLRQLNEERETQLHQLELKYASALQQKDTQIGSLQSELQALRDKSSAQIRSLEGTVSALQKELDKSREMLGELEAKQAKAIAQMRDVLKQQYEKEIEALVAKNKTLDQALADARTQLQAAELKVRTITATVADRDATIQRLTGEHATALKAKEVEIADLIKRLQAKEADITKLTQERTAAQHELARVQAEMQSKLRMAEEKAAAQLAEQKHALEVAHAAATADLKAQLRKLEDTVAARNEEIRKLKSQLEEQERHFEQVKSAALAAQAQKYTLEIRALTEKLASVENENEAFRARIVSLMTMIDTIKKEKEDALARLREQLEAVSREHAEELKRLRETLEREALMREEALKQRIATLESVRIELQKRIEEMQRQFHDEKVALVAEIQAKILAAQEENARAVHERDVTIMNQKNEIALLLARIAALEQSAASAVESHSRSVVVVQDEFSSILEQRLAALRAQYDGQLADLRAQASAANEQKRSLADRLERLEKDLLEAQLALKNREASLLQLRDSNAAELARRDEEIARLNKEHLSYRSTIERTITERNTTETSLKGDYAALQSQLRDLELRARQAEADRDAVKQAADFESKRLKETQALQLRSAQEAHDALSATLKKKDEDLRRVEQERDEKAGELRTVSAKLRDEVDRLTSELKTSRTEITRLQTSIEDARRSGTQQASAAGEAHTREISTMRETHRVEIETLKRSAQDEADKLRRGLADHESKHKALEARLKSEEEKYLLRIKELQGSALQGQDAVQKMLAEREASVASLQSELGALREQLSRAKDDAAQAQARLAEEKSKHLALVQVDNEHKLQLEGLQAEKSKWQTAEKELRQQISTMQTTIVTSTSQIDLHTDEKYQHQIRDLQEKLAAQAAESSKKISHLEFTIATLESKIRELEQENQDQRAQIRKLREALAEASSQQAVTTTTTTTSGSSLAVSSTRRLGTRSPAVAPMYSRTNTNEARWQKVADWMRTENVTTDGAFPANLANGEAIVRTIKALDKTHPIAEPSADAAANITAILQWQRASGHELFEEGWFAAARTGAATDLASTQLLGGVEKLCEVLGGSRPSSVSSVRATRTVQESSSSVTHSSSTGASALDDASGPLPKLVLPPSDGPVRDYAPVTGDAEDEALAAVLREAGGLASGAVLRRVSAKNYVIGPAETPVAFRLLAKKLKMNYQGKFFDALPGLREHFPMVLANPN